MQMAEIVYWLPLLYIITVNFVAFLSMWWDKRKASQNEWRVAEAVLHLLGIIGGAIGIFSGMYKFRHKTRKRSFQVIAIIGLIVSLLIYWLVLIQYI